jgi:hypothetical protein
MKVAKVADFLYRCCPNFANKKDDNVHFKNKLRRSKIAV